MQKNFVSLAVCGAFLALGSQVALAAPDWSKVAKSNIHVFHPGAAPIEWVQGKGDHSGASGLKKGESCAGCHIEDLNRGPIGVAEVRFLLARESDPPAVG